MRREVLGGLAMARRRWSKVVVVAVLIALPGAFVAMVASETITQVDVARASVTLQRQHAVGLNLFRPPDSSVDVSVLQAPIVSGRGYTTVLVNAGIGLGRDQSGPSLGYVMGDAARRLYPSLHLCSPAPCAMRGHDVEDQDMQGLPFDARPGPGQDLLPRGAAILTPNTGTVRLDETILLVLPATDLPQLGTPELTDAVGSAVLLDPTGTQVDEVVDALARQGVVVQPHALTDGQSGLRRELVTSGLYLVGVGAFLVLVLMSFAASVTRMATQERRSLTIRRMYGATTAGVRVRLGTFLSCVAAVPTATLIAMRAFGDPVITQASSLVLVAMVIFWVVLWLRVCSLTGIERRPLGAGSGL